MNEIILTYLTAFAPAVTAICGIIASGFYAASRLAKVVKEIKGDNYQKDLQVKAEKLAKSDEELKNEIRGLIRDNAQKSREIRMLIDQIARIEGYSDEVLDEDKKV